MVALNKHFALENPHTVEENRVGIFFGESTKSSRANPLSAQESRLKKVYGYDETATARSNWPNRDPIGERGGITLYGFVGNDGIGYFDAFGLYPCNRFQTGSRYWTDREQVQITLDSKFSIWFQISFGGGAFGFNGEVGAKGESSRDVKETGNATRQEEVYDRWEESCDCRKTCTNTQGTVIHYENCSEVSGTRNQVPSGKFKRVPDQDLSDRFEASKNTAIEELEAIGSSYDIWGWN